ncbi:hypothetical protein L3D22_07850 [Lysobacter soli]|uniref:hypothetical protein n=1 Tax=Lysobacter TaxID=68 RepID=UPI00178A231A|nr:hypothetical protein [Lysobacter soli]UTA55698.1 hypothetical protein L3D22_07850 [Lysobacter soli]
MTIERGMQERIVAAARLAPSAHNTQPARWRFERGGSIVLLGDTTRRLPCADPGDRDFALSCGAALEATVLSLGPLGIGVASVEPGVSDARSSLPEMARITPGGVAVVDPLTRWMEARSTWRGGFVPATDEQARSLHTWAAMQTDVILATEPDDRVLLAELNDRATAGFLRDAHWRAELCDWMRLSPRHPAYARDGMNREALHMGAIDAAGARWVLGKAYAWLDRAGLSTALVGERARSMTANAIVLLHRPADETPLASGRILYRHWLALTSFGFAAWPMSAAVDDAECAGRIVSHFDVPSGRRLLAALRVGKALGVAARVRLPVGELIVA